MSKYNFSNHVAKLTEFNPTLSILELRIPNTKEQSIDYVFKENYLFVSGDWCTAIFRFTQDIDLESIVTYDFNYFKDKLIFAENKRTLERYFEGLKYTYSVLKGVKK